MNYLNKVTEKVEELYVQCKAYNAYQEELELDRTDFQHVFELRRDNKIKSDMWRAMMEWDVKFADWKTTDFAEIDVAKISEEVEGYHKIAMRSKSLEEDGNRVPGILRNKVSTLRDTMPVVIALRDPAL
jgi:hypothetical protein